jgi:two-component system, chemotaxis family, chemotaxis protein CheY
MSYNILIVDDSSIVRAIIKKSLAICGIEIGSVYEASNGREALAKLSAEWIDLVFADINMPEMTGIEMVAKMAENNLLDSIPVVIVSTERNEAQIEELKKQGVRAYIKKPFRPELLRDVVHHVLSNPGGDHGS